MDEQTEVIRPRPGPRPAGQTAITPQNQNQIAPPLSVYRGDTPEEQATFEQFKVLSSRERLLRLVEGEKAINSSIQQTANLLRDLPDRVKGRLEWYDVDWLVLADQLDKVVSAMRIP